MSHNHTYTIQSVETGYYVTSTSDEKSNSEIKTVDGEGGIPAGATLTFNKALEPGNNIDVTIKGISELYAGWALQIPFPRPVAWSEHAVNWQVQMTSTPGVYVIIPKDGDLYWFTSETMSHVGVKQGKDVVGKENQWYIKKVD